jgi:hypothetical protein
MMLSLLSELSICNYIGGVHACSGLSPGASPQPFIFSDEPQPCAQERKMSTAIFVRNGTAVGRKSLCYTCRRAHIQVGFSDCEEEIRCGFYFKEPLVVSFAVRECSNFLDKLTPTLDEMEDIALVINVKKCNVNAGFASATANNTPKTVADEDDR